MLEEVEAHLETEASWLAGQRHLRVPRGCSPRSSMGPSAVLQAYKQKTEHEATNSRVQARLSIGSLRPTHASVAAEWSEFDVTLYYTEGRLLNAPVNGKVLGREAAQILQKVMTGAGGIRRCPLERSPNDIHIPSSQMAYGWYGMAENVHQLRSKPGDSEKITINLGYVDLGHIDLMVQEGFYSNRTDFIRTAIRNQLERHADVVKQSTVRKRLDLGLRHYSREDLEAARLAGEMLHIQVLGLASIALDVTPELARAAIASVVVLGALHASPTVKAALADRMR